MFFKSSLHEVCSFLLVNSIFFFWRILNTRSLGGKPLNFKKHLRISHAAHWSFLASNINSFVKSYKTGMWDRFILSLVRLTQCSPPLNLLWNCYCGEESQGWNCLARHCNCLKNTFCFHHFQNKLFNTH